MKVSQKIRNARLNLSQKLGYSISQGEFSKMCGFGPTGQSRLSNYETGKRVPSLEDLLRIIAVSGASPKEFFDPNDLEGMELEHVEGALKKVAEESSIPRNLAKTLGVPEVSNSIDPFIIDPASPLIDEDSARRYAVFSADRSSEIASAGDLIYVNRKITAINRSGWWMIKVGSVAVHDKIKIMPNGSAISDEYGEISSSDLEVIGAVESVWKKVP